MLRFRYAPLVPPGAANLAYIQAPVATPRTHLAKIDYAADIPENIVDNFGSEIIPVVQPAGDPVLTPEYIDTDQILISNRSVISKNSTRPAKLYYKITLGLGTYSIFDPEASAANLANAREIIRKHIRLLDGNFNPINTIAWDIDVTAAGPVSKSFAVDLFLERLGDPGQSLVAQYHAIDSSGTKVPNYREVLNPTPILTNQADYTIVDTGSNGFEITGLSPSNLAPALALFGSGVATVGTITIDFGSGNIVLLTANSVYRPVADVVADINALDIAVEARALSSHDKAQLRAGSYTLATTGTVIRFDRNAHVKYLETFRVQALKPSALHALTPWYPRISRGHFTRNLGDTNGPYRYEVRDFFYQSFNTTYGQPYKDATLEEPLFLDEQKLQALHRPIRANSDITVFVDGVADSTLLSQVDLYNGTLFLSRSIQAGQNILISYVYESQEFVYQNINLNPTLKHNPDIISKFVGLYIIPRKYLGASLTFERTIYHMVRSTATEIETAVAALKLSNGNPAEAKLLAIYRVVQTETPADLDIIDTRAWGGGLREDLDPTEVNQPETEFYADIGAHFDGKPYPDAGTVIIQLPDTIPGTGQVDAIQTLYDGYGNLQPIDPSGWVNPTGLLTRDEILVKLREHADPGTFIIEDYY